MIVYFNITTQELLSEEEACEEIKKTIEYEELWRPILEDMPPIEIWENLSDRMRDIIYDKAFTLVENEDYITRDF